MKGLIDKVKKFKYVSFDIFDTLIKRNVNVPTDVFKIIEQKYGFDSFYENRILCERKARKSTETEITIDDIYSNLSSYYSSDDIERLKNLEISLEIQLCVFNQELKELYNYCINSGKKIIITSDMYLPQEVIEKILSKNNIKYDKLYLSSTLKKTKEKGDLYKLILSDLNISSKELVHIGDNKKSDYLSAKRNGISAIKIATRVSRLTHYNLNDSNLDNNIFRTFINNTLDKKTYFYNIGYEILGPFLYLFCRWLNENLCKDNISQVLFFSRDGLIIKDAYDKIYPNGKIKTTYFYASRRALIVPSLMYYDSVDKMIENMYLEDEITLKSLLKNLGIDNYSIELSNYGLSLEDRIRTSKISENLNLKKLFDDIYPVIVENSKQEKENFLKYFSREVSEERIAIVDIGWFGNMQNAFQTILSSENIDIFVEGFYTGLVPSSLNQTKYNMKGFMFDATHDQELHEYEKRFNCVFEMLFLANHGSVKKYDVKGDLVEVIFKDHENKENQKIIDEYQSGAKAFIGDFVKDDISKKIDCSNIRFIDALFDFGNNPNMLDAKMFGDLNFDSGSRFNYIAKPNKLYKYIFNPKNLYRDFNSAYWKIGFLKRLIKFNIDYNKLYDKLKNFKRR